MIQDANQWATEVFGTCQLGDIRRTNRLVKLSGQLSIEVGSSLGRACRMDAAAMHGAYRFVENDHVDAASIAEGGFSSTVEHAQSVNSLLMVEDTTSLSFRHSVCDQLGDLGGPKQSKARGWLVHSSLLLSEQSEEAVGLIDQQWWYRQPSSRGKRHTRRARMYQEKESFKWESSTRRASDRLGDLMSRVVTVCDREADVFEYLSWMRTEGHRFVVRGSWDRRLLGCEADVWSKVVCGPVLGYQTVEIPQRGGQHCRTAKVALRSALVTLRPPSRGQGEKLFPIEVWAVSATEIKAPSDVEPLNWKIYTTEPSQTFEQVKRVMRIYRLRWRIEDFHKAWKSGGCRVESQRLQEADHLQRLAMVLSFIAVRILQLRDAAEKRPKVSCTELLNQDQWQCLWMSVTKKQGKKAPPRKPPTLEWAYHAIGRLGGWYDSKRTGRVGWEALYKGWQELIQRVDVWRDATRLALAGKCG